MNSIRSIPPQMLGKTYNKGNATYSRLGGNDLFRLTIER